jgi:hypothetical protein
MTSHEAKLGAVAVALISTWTTAQADDFKVTIQSSSDLSNLQIYTDRLPGVVQPKDTPTLTANLGSLAAGGTYTTTVSTSYGTSVAGSNSGNLADFSVLATTATAGIVVGGANTTSNVDYNFHFGSRGLNQGTIRSAIVGNSLTGVRPLFTAGGQFDNRLYASQENGTVTGTLFNFDANGAQTRIGTYTVAPVPEPASMAALGLGIAAMLRRRKRA